MKNLIFAFSIMVLAVFVIACSQTSTTTEETTTVGETPQEPAAAENTTVEETTTVEQNITPAGPACIDSDNGLNTNFAGDVTDITGKKFYDKCIDSESLSEYKCGPLGNAVPKTVGCLHGCKDGACIPSPQETSAGGSASVNESSSSETSGNWTGSTAHCTDTDGGETYDLQGTCGDASSGNLKDTCIGSDTLIEWACHKTQDKCLQIQHECTCEAGACK
jgi:hypothetical protein